jgi:hypothetical protein
MRLAEKLDWKGLTHSVQTSVCVYHCSVDVLQPVPF